MESERRRVDKGEVREVLQGVRKGGEVDTRKLREGEVRKQ